MTFRLDLFNFCGDLAQDTVNITINPIVNLPPVAGATAPATVVEGANVTLDGSSSYDPESQALSYNWSQTAGPAVALNLANPAQPTFAAPVTGSAYALQFTLTVFDGQKTSDPVTVDIAVSIANQTPTSNAGAAQTVAYGDSVQLDGSASADADGDTLSYQWTQVSGSAVVLDVTYPAQPSFTAPSVTGDVKFSLVVNDGSVNSAASEVTVSVFPAAAIPDCDNARPNRSQIWPPKHQMVRVKIRGMEVSDGADDDSDDTDEDYGNVAIRILGVTSDEPTLGTGVGDTSPDALVSSVRPDGEMRLRDQLLLRSERRDADNGRVYGITFEATNTLSNASCTGVVNVCVPTLMGKKGQCVDSGQTYNAMQ